MESALPTGNLQMFEGRKLLPVYKIYLKKHGEVIKMNSKVI